MKIESKSGGLRVSHKPPSHTIFWSPQLRQRLFPVQSFPVSVMQCKVTEGRRKIDKGEQSGEKGREENALRRIGAEKGERRRQEKRGGRREAE